MYLAAVEHRIRRGVTAALDRIEDVSRWWHGDYERSDYLDTAERLRQQLVEREAEEDVWECVAPSCGCHDDPRYRPAAPPAEPRLVQCPAGDIECVCDRTPTGCPAASGPTMLEALEEAYWCVAHNTTRMACKDKPHQSAAEERATEPLCAHPILHTNPKTNITVCIHCGAEIYQASAHAGADTVPAESSPAGATSPAAGVTHPAPAVGLPPFNAEDLADIAAERIESAVGPEYWVREVAEGIVSALVAELAVLTVAANDQATQPERNSR